MLAKAKKEKVLGLRNGGGKLIFHHLVGGVFCLFLVKLNNADMSPACFFRVVRE